MFTKGQQIFCVESKDLSINIKPCEFVGLSAVAGQALVVDCGISRLFETARLHKTERAALSQKLKLCQLAIRRLGKDERDTMKRLSDLKTKGGK